MKSHKMMKVFTPGGFPTITYVKRQSDILEKRIRAAEGLNKLVVLTGSTKSGKTVLVDKLFPRSDNIWISGGSIETEQSFWESILDYIDGFTDYSTGSDEESSVAINAGIKMGGNVIIAKGEGQASTTLGSSSVTSSTLSRHISPKTAAVKLLINEERALIIDDFHYISKDIQKNIIRALKDPIMRGLPVIFIAIPNRKYDAVEVEREMTGRIDNLEMPVWNTNELKNIAIQGFSALNCSVSDTIISELAENAYGSPFLMQEFCKKICERNNIYSTSHVLFTIDEPNSLDCIFTTIADDSGRSIFDRLKKGPRVRTDRKPRHLKNGITTDIYGVVMEALKYLKPGVDSIQYEVLRNQIRDILSEQPPQKNEITRVLDQIAKISYTDTSSTPVIDWQKENDVLSITDPFFAFYLKWSN